MFEFHKDKQGYFNTQCTVTEEDIIPFIEGCSAVVSGKYVLEIGCAEAGVLKAFLHHQCHVVGVELSPSRYTLAQQFLSEEINAGKAKILNTNIYDINPKVTFDRPFEIIILKDVIEHIPDQEKFIPFLKEFLAEDGLIFFAYPPWYMPFGGHQQICSSKVLRSLPWFHLLPAFLFTAILKIFSEKQATTHELLDIKSTGISIERIHSILKKNGFKIAGQAYWLINPIYKFKFGIGKRKVPYILTKLPFVRNFYTTAHYIAFKK